MNRSAVYLFALLVAASSSIVSRSDAGPGNFINILSIPKAAPQIDGKRISTHGYILLNNKSLNIVSQPHHSKEQVCIGLLLPREKLDRLKKYSETWATISGTFSTHYCSGNNFCAYSCGPYTLSDIDIRN